MTQPRPLYERQQAVGARANRLADNTSLRQMEGRPEVRKTRITLGVVSALLALVLVSLGLAGRVQAAASDRSAPMGWAQSPNDDCKSKSDVQTRDGNTKS